MKGLITSLCTVLVFLASCTNNEKEIRALVTSFESQPVEIPYSLLERVECIPEQDTIVTRGSFRFVTYVDSAECLSCSFHQLTNNEQKVIGNSFMDSIKMEYIVCVPKSERKSVYINLCNSRLHGCVYFDYAGVTVKENPLLDKSSLLHSFVLNNRNEVVLVGNPFGNEKLYELLLEIMREDR